MMKPQPRIKGEVYRPPLLDMSVEAIAWRRRVYIEGDRRKPYGFVDSPTNRDQPPPLMLPPRVEFRPRFNANDF